MSCQFLVICFRFYPGTQNSKLGTHNPPPITVWVFSVCKFAQLVRPTVDSSKK